MEARQAREIGEALAFLSGDFRDEPLTCARCKSERVERDYVRDLLRCCECGQFMTMHVAAEMREERARKRVARGVGGP